MSKSRHIRDQLGKLGYAFVPHAEVAAWPRFVNKEFTPFA
jgi:hypothetical protein